MSGPRKSILIADNEQGFRDLFPFTLEPLGYEVVVVSDGQEALDQVRQRSFDLVILDVHMPRMDGLESLTRIRELRPAQRVLIMSGSYDPDQTFESRATEAGAMSCLSKPVALDEILQAVEQALAPAGGKVVGGGP